MKVKSLGANKTEIHLGDGSIVFVSYETPVAAFLPEKGYFRTKEKFSATTTRHINQWLEGVRAESLSQETMDRLLQPRLGDLGS